MNSIFKKICNVRPLTLTYHLETDPHNAIEFFGEKSIIVSSSKVRDFESALVSWILEPRALLFHFNEQKFDAISAYLACVYDRLTLLQTKTVFTPSKPGRKMIKIYSRRFRLVSLSE